MCCGNEVAHRIADMRRGYDPRIQEKGEKLDDRIQVKEQDDFFSACTHASRSVAATSRPFAEGDEPTAVYLLLICKIMIMVMRIATMWTKHVAVWFKTRRCYSSRTCESRDLHGWKNNRPDISTFLL